MRKEKEMEQNEINAIRRKRKKYIQGYENN
jgi:hypothetical protein